MSVDVVVVVVVSGDGDGDGDVNGDGAVVGRDRIALRFARCRSSFPA